MLCRKVFEAADAVVTTTEMNIRFLAACRTDITADARVIQFGSTLCPVAVSLFDLNGTELAIAQVTYIRRRFPGQHFAMPRFGGDWLMSLTGKD